MVQTGTKPFIDYSNYIVDRTHNFSGRIWVFKAIDDWLAKSEMSRFFLLHRTYSKVLPSALFVVPGSSPVAS